MDRGSRDQIAPEAPPAAEPGALTQLIEQLAAAPDKDGSQAWENVLRPGDVLDRFEILRELGRGGFGAVYEALDRDLGRRVALKTLRPGRSRDEWTDEQLKQEARAAASLAHQGVVTLYEACTCDRGPYLVMELLRGETLEARLARGPLPVEEAVEVGLQAARALAHVHGQRLVHRDLKPGNVFLGEDGRVKLLDLGLAHLLGKRSSTGGTPAYVAPEQWRGEEVDGRADVFALGAVLFEALAGRRPFEVKDGRSAALDAGPVPELGGAVPRALARLVTRCLAGAATERPTSAQVAEELLEVQRALTRPRHTSRMALLLGAGLVAGLALAAGVAWWLAPRGPVAEADGRVVVAVADFVNETREPELDGLSGQLITSLEQSQRLRVLTRTRMVDVLRRLGKPSVAAVDEALGREVALAAGVRALVVATIRRFDQLYAIDLKVLDPKTSEYFFTLKEEHAGKDSIPGMLDRLSEEARLRLREGPADVQASRVRVAEALTGSFAAYQHFFRGDQFKDSIHYDQAILEYRQAIAIDPGFPLAHYRIAYLGHFTGLDEAARRAEIDAALRGVDRVAEKERLLIQAWKAVMDGRKEEAHRLYARVVEAYPQDKEALFMAGDLYLHEDRQAEGMPFFERAVALDPAWEPAMMHLVDCLYALGRDGELMLRSREWTERAPGGQSFRALALAYGAAGKPAEAVAAARRAYEIDRTAFARANFGEALLFGERFEEAEALARQALDAPLSGVEAGEATPLLITALAYQGRRREALQLLDAAPPDLGGEKWLRDSMRLDIMLGDDKPEAALALARAVARRADGPKKPLPLILALLGDPASAAEAAKVLHAGSYLDLYEAAAAWRRGETDQAARRLRAVTGRPTERDSHAPAWWMLARIAVERGQARDAVAAVERFRVTHGGVWRSWALPESLLLEARAEEQLGERSKAAATLDHLLGLWKRADPDLPRLAEARAMRARLAASSQR